MEAPPPIFADVHLLLESSVPQQRASWFGYGIIAFVLVVIMSSAVAARAQESQHLIQAVSSIAMVFLVTAMSMLTWATVRRQRAEHARLEAAEELVQLRRWPEAALLLQMILSRPTRSQQTRLQALVYFSSVLARFRRFEDVVAIDEHLLDTVPLDDPSAHAVKLGRAMALLQDDRLFDADRAIADLRHTPDAANSGALALLEMFRDVKTGHPVEALEIFAAKRDLIRKQLGHRVADAYALAAKAYDLQNLTDEAKFAYETATLLSPLIELNRRYPDIVSLGEKYAPTPAPAEVVG